MKEHGDWQPLQDECNDEVLKTMLQGANSYRVPGALMRAQHDGAKHRVVLAANGAVMASTT